MPTSMLCEIWGRPRRLANGSSVENNLAALWSWRKFVGTRIKLQGQGWGDGGQGMSSSHLEFHIQPTFNACNNFTRLLSVIHCGEGEYGSFFDN
jgi:hypothetical protein